MNEMRIVAESLEFKLNALKETGVGIAQNIFNKEDTGVVIDGLTSVLGVVDQLTEKLGFFGSVGTGVGIALLVKNLGNVKKGFSALSAGESVASVASKGFGKLASSIGLSAGALGGFIGVAAGIAAVVTIVDLCTTSFKELKKNSDTSWSNYQETKNNISSINSELETTKQRIEELQSKDKLTLTEEQELNNLERRNQLLENQLKYQQQLSDIQEKAAANDAVDVLFQKDDFNGSSLIERYNNQQNNEQELLRKQQEVQQRLANNYTEEDMNPTSIFKTEGQKAYAADVKEAANLEKQIASLESDMAENAATISEYSQRFQDYAYDSETGLIKPEYIDYMRSFADATLYSGTVTEQAAQKQQALSDILASEDYSEAIEGLRQYTEESGKTNLSLDEIKENLGEETFLNLATTLAESGISMAEFQYQTSKAGDAIADVNLDTLKDNALEAKKALLDAGKVKQQFDYNGNEIGGIDFSSESAIDSTISKMDELKNSATVEMDASDIENANKVLAYALEQKQELNRPAVLDVDSSELTPAQSKLQSLLSEFQSVQNQREIEIAVGADTSDSDAKLQSLQQQIQSQTAEIDVEAKVDTSSVNSISSALQNNSFSAVITPKVSSIGEQKASGVVEYTNKTTKLPEQKASGTINWSNKVSTPQVNDIYKNIYYTYKTTNSKPDSGSGGFNGTAHAYGTAFAGGNWGAGHGGRALVGELGTEIRVNSNTGTWETIGENGAEFIHVNPHDIIFNHVQTESLLNNGYVAGRGTSFARGTAFASGKSYAKGKTALEKFQDWFGKLFDWIEIRLERQAKKIERLTKRADYNVDRGKYDTAAGDYRSAISSSITQMRYQNTAASKYQSKADSIVNRAVKKKLISKKQAKTIKNGVENGTLNISSYGKKMQEVIKDYQEFYEKAQDAKDAIQELRESIYGYIKSLKDLRDAQRDAKIDKSEALSSIATSGLNTRAVFSGTQLKARNDQLVKQQEAYETGVNNLSSDISKRASNAKSTASSTVASAIKNASKQKVNGKKLTKKQLKSYKSALKKAQDCIKASKAIPNGTLNTIKKYNSSAYNTFFSYNQNLAIAGDIDKILQESRLEAAQNYAETSAEIYQNQLDITGNLNDRQNTLIDRYEKQADAATSLSSKNSYLDKAAQNYTNIVSNSQNLVDTLYKDREAQAGTITKGTGKTSKLTKLAASNKTRKDVEEAINAAKADVQKRVAIGGSVLANLANYYSQGYVTYAFYKACVDYNNAINAWTQANDQLIIDKATAQLERAAIGRQQFENTQNAYSINQETISSRSSLRQAQQDVKTTKGLSLGVSDYSALLADSRNMQTSYTNEITALNKVISENLSKGYWTTASQEYKEALNTVTDFETKVQECIKDQQEYNNTLAQLPYDTIDKAIERLDAIEKYYDSIISLNSQLGKDSSEGDYIRQINANQDKLVQLQKEAQQAQADWKKALASSEGVYGGKTSAEWEATYLGYKSDINSLQADIDKLSDSLRDDVYWRGFERAHDVAERLQDRLSGIEGLIDDDMLFDKNGDFTDYGVTKVALLAKQFETARSEVQNYSNDIKNLNKLYAQGLYTRQEYLEKQAELQKNLLSSASDMKGYINDIRDMYKDIDQSELDALNKLIDARRKALESKKNYYEYDKSIRDKTKDIQELTSQIAALEGVNSAEARAQMAKLKEELAEAQEDLEDTRMDHYFDLSSDALDDMQDILEDEFDEKWDKLELNLDDLKQLLSDAQALSTQNTAQITTSINKLLAFYGISAGSTGISAFASGTRRINSSLVGLSNESGSELLVTKNGIISHFNPGDGVVPSALTQRLYAMANGNLPIAGVSGGTISPEIHQHYDSLINIEGSADAATVEDLKRFSQDILEKSYDYTTRRIKQDYVRTGGSRRV